MCLKSRLLHLFAFYLFYSSLSAVECVYHPLERIMLIMPSKSQWIWGDGGLSCPITCQAGTEGRYNSTHCAGGWMGSGPVLTGKPSLARHRRFEARSESYQLRYHDSAGNKLTLNRDLVLFSWPPRSVGYRGCLVQRIGCEEFFCGCNDSPCIDLAIHLPLEVMNAGIFAFRPPLVEWS